jgi:hypothetical protein
MPEQEITEAPSLTIEKAAELMALWIEPARDAFAAGQPVHLSLSPGEGTCYALSFIPAGMPGLATEGEHLRVSPGQGLLAMPVHGKAIVIAPDGQPWPAYAEEKLGSDNSALLLAVGMAWWLMVGNTPESFADAWGPWLKTKRYNPLPEWKPEYLTGGAWIPAGGPLAAADLSMALSRLDELDADEERDPAHVEVALRQVAQAARALRPEAKPWSDGR